MKISIMTLSMLLRYLQEYWREHDLQKLTDNYRQMMEMIAAAGYEKVDVTSFEISTMGQDTVHRIVTQSGLRVCSYIYLDTFAQRCNVDLAEQIKQTKAAVDAAAMLRADVLMLAPLAGEQINTYSNQQLKEEMAARWRPAVLYAKELGIHPVLENTPDLRLHLCQPDELQQMLDAVPELEVVFDSGNALLANEDPSAYFAQFAAKAAHVHLKDVRLAAADDSKADTAIDGKKYRGAPIGKGVVDLKAFVRQTRLVGYDGWYTIEFYVEDGLNVESSLVRCKAYVQQLL